MKHWPVLVLIIYAIIATCMIGNGNSEHICPLPSPQEIQERIGVEPDGIIGKETMAAWKSELIKQYAAEDNEKYIGVDGYLDSERK